MILMNDFCRDGEGLIHTLLVAAEGMLRSGWYMLGGGAKVFEMERMKA